MASLILKVTPEEVRAKGIAIRAKKNEMEADMADVYGKISQLSGHWKAPSGVDYVDKYNNVRTNILNSLQALEKHCSNLMQAAESYETLENQQERAVNSLSSDQIFS